MTVFCSANRREIYQCGEDGLAVVLVVYIPLGITCILTIVQGRATVLLDSYLDSFCWKKDLHVYMH